MSINLKNINIAFNQGHWDPRTQSILLEYDDTSPVKFKMKLIEVYKDDPVDNTETAESLLKKFRLR